VPITLGTNIASIGAQRRLADNSNRLTDVYQRLSSGQRINRASDDAAGLAVATSLNARTRIYSQAIRNVSDGISALNIADQSIANLTGIVTRQTELAAQAANGVYSSAQRQSLNNEAQALNQEYGRIIQTTKFNNLNLLDGSNTSINLQAGIGNGSVLAAQIFGQSTTSTSSSNTVNGLNNSVLSFNGLTHMDDSGFLIADMNGDGIQDIVAVSLSDTAGSRNARFALQVYLGNASGSFSAADFSDVQGILGSAGAHVNSGSVSAVLSYGAVGGGVYPDILADCSISWSSGGVLPTPPNYANNSSGGVLNLAYNASEIGPGADQTTAGGTSVADFNGDGVSDDLTINGDGTFTVGIHTSTTTTTTSSTTTTQSITQAGFDLTTAANAKSALDAFNSQINTLGQIRGLIGASISRVLSASSVLDVTRTNYAAASERIMSADVASDSAELTRTQILQSAAASVLAQANIQPNIALQLLK